MSEKLFGLSRKLSKSAERIQTCVCLEKCSLQGEGASRKKSVRERVWVTKDHRKASYRMISYAYRMCAMFQDVGIEFEEPENLEWSTIAMWIGKHEEDYKILMKEIKDMQNFYNSMPFND